MATKAARDGDCGCRGESASVGCAGSSLPDDPACAVNYHFGMLLGAEDFRTDQGFHIGHARRHQRSLHGAGVVWGYGVSRNAARLELRVEPGFALDHAGRDLQLDKPQCLGLADWWKAHRDDPIFDGVDRRDVTFDADVVLCARSCLSRAVPAIADSCSDVARDVQYSRICESVEIRLVPRDQAAPTAAAQSPRYRLLQALLGFGPLTEPDADDSADEQWLAQRQQAIGALPEAEQSAAIDALLTAVVSRSTARTGPPSLPLPTADEQCPAGLIIATVRDLRFQTSDGESGEIIAVTLDPANVSIDARASLLPAWLLQATLLRPEVAVPAPSVGPLVKSASLNTQEDALIVSFDQALAVPSVTPSAFTVSEFTATGWRTFTLTDAKGTAAAEVTLALGTAATGSRLRLTVRGTGAAPVLGQNLIPAGARVPRGDGLDLTTTISRG